jgi:mannose-6-phosphate isomerase-like protein (cupin superfamily)
LIHIRIVDYNEKLHRFQKYSPMAHLITIPAIIKAAGNKEKIIKEYFGRVNSKTDEVSIAMMKSPQGWEEPGQCPEFNEYTIVLKGSLKIKTKEEEFIVSGGMGILTSSGEWVQYSSPFEGGAEYIAICLPAFSPEIVHRD